LSVTGLIIRTWGENPKLIGVVKITVIFLIFKGFRWCSEACCRPALTGFETGAGRPGQMMLRRQYFLAIKRSMHRGRGGCQEPVEGRPVLDTQNSDIKLTCSVFTILQNWFKFIRSEEWGIKTVFTGILTLLFGHRDSFFSSSIPANLKLFRWIRKNK